MSPEVIKRHYTHTQEILSHIAGFLFIIPLAPFLCRFTPPVIIAGWNYDLVISILISVIIVRLMLWLIKPMILPALLFTCGILLYNQYNRSYSFSNVMNDYKTLVNQNWGVREQKQTDILSFDPHLFEDAGEKTTRLVKGKVQYRDSIVRNFSVQHSLEYFDEYSMKYHELARYFSLFKYINAHFKYVPDTYRDEYYATPKETILNGLGGDCDDHSILMASCLMSIGATCRLVIIEGHMYPEIYAGDKKDFDIMQQAIIQFFGDQNIDRIYYHENNGEYWVNLDYTAHHPGGYYLNNDVKMVINLG